MILMNYFLIAGLSYFILLLSLAGPQDLLLPYISWLMILFSFPHFMGTYWVWGSRVKNWKNEWWALIFPFVYIGLFLSARSLNSEYYNLDSLLKLSYLYLLYHFAQQLYGITLWWGMNFKQFYSPVRKHFLRALFLFASFYTWLEMETREVVGVLFYHPVVGWNLPSEIISLTFYLVLILSGILFFWSFWDFFKYKSTRSFIPLAPIGLCWIWFLPPINQKMSLILPVLHGLQYFPFIMMKAKHLSQLKRIQLIGLSILAGWVFFRWLPFKVALMEGTLWPALVISLMNNHHFIIDGRIWKLRDPANQDLLVPVKEVT